MERKEPTLSLHPATTELKERVRLTWGEVRELAESTPQEPTLVRAEPKETSPAEAPKDVATETSPAPNGTPIPSEPPAPQLTEEDLRRLADVLAPRIEQAIREHLRQALDMSLGNALQRARSDVERSVGPIVQQTVLTELRRLDLTALKPRY